MVSGESGGLRQPSAHVRKASPVLRTELGTLALDQPHSVTENSLVTLMITVSMKW